MHRPYTMYRRRDSNQGRSAYSSADAYRALHSPPSSNSHNSHSAHNDSSEDEANLAQQSPVPSTTPIAAAFARRRSSDLSGGAPLSPPRPFFLGNEARSSWSAASSENNSVNDQSDSDSPVPVRSGMAGVGAGAATAPRTSAARGTSRSRSSTQSQPVAQQSPSQTNPRVRTRNHRRRSSVANEYAPEADSEEATTVAAAPAPPPKSPKSPAMASVASVSAQSNPFDTPASSVYGMPAGAAPPLVASARPPPSAFPFQSHPRNPAPGTPIPGMGRRASIDSIRAREAAQADLPRSPGYAVYPAGAAVGGYGLISPGASEYEGDLARPYAPFMENGVPSREGSATPPSPMASQNHLYRNSAAAAMAGSSSALNQQFGKC